MTAPPASPLQRQDWIRFQLKQDQYKRVLEGYVQEVAQDGQRVRVGKEPDGAEHQWFDLSEFTLLQRQTLHDAA